MLCLAKNIPHLLQTIWTCYLAACESFFCILYDTTVRDTYIEATFFQPYVIRNIGKFSSYFHFSVSILDYYTTMKLRDA